MDAVDLQALREMIYPEFVGYFPQSGERLHGFGASAAQLVNYPGAERPTAEIPNAQVVGGQERWATTPSYTDVPLASPSFYTILMRSEYPDGSHWYVITLVEMRDRKAIGQRPSSCPNSDRPQWRRRYAEIVPRERTARLASSQMKQTRRQSSAGSAAAACRS